MLLHALVLTCACFYAPGMPYRELTVGMLLHTCPVLASVCSYAHARSTNVANGPSSTPFSQVFIVVSGIVQWTVGNHRPYYMQPGSLFGDVEFLLVHAGVKPEELGFNSARAEAKTLVSVYAIEIKNLSKVVGLHPAVLQNLWRQVSPTICSLNCTASRRFPEKSLKSE